MCVCIYGRGGFRPEPEIEFLMRSGTGPLARSPPLRIQMQFARLDLSGRRSHFVFMRMYTHVCRVCMCIKNGAED